MADVYVRSGAAGTGTGADWANAYTTLGAALTAKAAGDTFYVSEDHAESTAGAVTLTSPGTAASPCRIVCVNHSGTVPPVSADLRTTATVTTTGANSINMNGFAYVYGISFAASTGGTPGRIFFGSNAASFYWIMQSCALSRPSAGTIGSAILIGNTTNTDRRVDLINTTISIGNAGDSIVLKGSLNWFATPNAIAGATLPTALFGASGGNCGGYLRCIGVDFSALGSGKSLFTVSGNEIWDVLFQDCKLGSSVAITTGNVVSQGGVVVRAVNCASADTNYRYYRQNYQATETDETTIVRTGGATDGTTPVSRKVVTTANAKFYAPYQSDWIPFWNTATGSALTVAIPVVTDNVTLTDADAWIEVEGLGTSGFPLGTFTSDAAADVLAVAVNQTTDSTSLWPAATGTPVKQILSTTFTPQKAGFLRARVCVAKASLTMYYDPAPINGSWVKYGAYAYTVGPDGVTQQAGASAGGGSAVGKGILIGGGM